MINTTASGLERVLACHASTFLPVRVNGSNPYSKRGNEGAGYIRAIIGGASRQDAAKLVSEPKWLRTFENIDFRKLFGDLSDVRGEMAYAIDVAKRTCRELGSNIGRNYPKLLDTEYGGTNDIEGKRYDGIPVVIDVKTGVDVTPCHKNTQIMFHAAALMLRSGASEVEGRIAYIREDGSVFVDAHTFQAFDLECFLDTLEALGPAVQKSKESYESGKGLSVYTGDHCKYCECKSVCPGYVGLLKSVLLDAQSVEPKDWKRRLQVLQPAKIGEAWANAKAAERALEAMVKALKELAGTVPVTLPNGKRLDWIKRPQNRFNQERAIAMLRSFGVTETEIRELFEKSETSYIGETGRKVA